MTHVEKIENKHYVGETIWLIKIDKGSDSNINNRLTFKSRNGDFSIKIDSVNDTHSFGYFEYNFSLERFPIGTELRTKWE